MSTKEVLKDMSENLSDHYPVRCLLELSMAIQASKPENNSQQAPTVIKWDKIDQDLYSARANNLAEELLGKPIQTCNHLGTIMDKLQQTLYQAAADSSTKKARYKAKPKLKIWTPDIKTSLSRMRECYNIWKQNGSPTDPNNKVYQDRVLSRKKFKRLVKVEQAKQRQADKNEILEARTRDSKLYHKLVKNNRGKNRNAIMELQVKDEWYSGNQVIEGFTEHFGKLASAKNTSELKDQKYHDLVEYETNLIQEIVKGKTVQPATPEEIKKAIKTINKGKSADIYGVTIEHFIYAGEKTENLLLQLINAILELGEIPDSLKTGLLTPVFKNKGDRNQATNYRGITVLPVVNKIVEAIIRDRLQPLVLKDQNPVQRGFTVRSSPLNAALIVEEAYRESVDTKQKYELVLLDAKSAFDVVIHSHLMRKLFHCGIDDTLWRIIASMHTNATSAIKWAGKVGESFQVDQGVRQGGILSTDLYKIYINNLLNRLQHSGRRCKIGNINCNTTACADDVALLGISNTDMQVQINISSDYAGMEGYKLQPQKSVAIHIQPKPVKAKYSIEPDQYLLCDSPMPNVTKSTHLGIIRTPSMKDNIEANIEENIKKARRSAYALLGSGFHGENGLDQESLIHLFKTYFLPVLLYGMEILTPKTRHLEMLQKFQKKMLKQLLSIPQNSPDPAVYILTGILPIEAQIHIKLMTFFCNICAQSECSVEKKLGKRQLTVKNTQSASWYIEVQRVMLKYNLGSALDLLNSSDITKMKTAHLKRAIEKHWATEIIQAAELYQGLRFMNASNYKPGRIYELLTIQNQSVRDRIRLPVKIKLLTGSYILQPLRYKIFKEGTENTCSACNSAEETIEHLLLECTQWEDIRRPITEEISSIMSMHSNRSWNSLSQNDKLQTLLDITVVQRRFHLQTKALARIEHQTRRLIALIHNARCKFLLTPKTTTLN